MRYDPDNDELIEEHDDFDQGLDREDDNEDDNTGFDQALETMTATALEILQSSIQEYNTAFRELADPQGEVQVPVPTRVLEVLAAEPAFFSPYWRIKARVTYEDGIEDVLEVENTRDDELEVSWEKLRVIVVYQQHWVGTSADDTYVWAYYRSYRLNDPQIEADVLGLIKAGCCLKLQQERA